jgi:4-alpha-glucanotransferase
MTGMTWDDLLCRLASLVGIEPFYFDIRGHRHEASIGTKARTLSALGLDVSSISTLEAAVLAMEQEQWQRWLAPFVVRIWDAERFSLDLFLPADEANDQWSWEVAFEDGEIARGTFRPKDLSMLGARDIDGQRIEHLRLEIQLSIPIGYHRIRIAGEHQIETALVIAPACCYLPPALDGDDQREWGISAHLYSLRSKRNWGVGDFSDLARLCQLVGAAGGSAVATNPFHALFPRRPDDASPYAPSSRLFLNPIYVDISAASNFCECQPAHPPASMLASLRETKLVDYPKLWATKLPALEALFAAFQARLVRGSTEDRETADFRHFVAQGGSALLRFAVFSVLDELHGGGANGAIPWHRWPLTYRSPDTAAVERIVTERSDRVTFYKYLQYLADRQLRAVAEQAKQAGLEIGLVRDLALGASPDGADAWMEQKALAQSLRCGAPPDDFHPDGQEWGVIPLHPIALRRDYSPLIAMFRANMRHAGGLRVDHIIGFQRQFLVPQGGSRTQGCYIRYPFEEMTALLALESQRNACMVIGEDLGTVPEGFRDRMRQKRAFGCAILYFERSEGGRFRTPGEYPRHVVASAATHDLPTLLGYQRAQDIALRRQLGIYTNDRAEMALAERRNDCLRLFEALAAAGFQVPSASGGCTADPRLFLQATHAFLAASTARLFLAQLDDVLAEVDQINVPGTVYEYPNWRRKLSLDLDDPALIEEIAELARICAAQGRGRVRDSQV